MQLLQITPWGFTTPGSSAVVVDDPDFGQRLWLLAMDENDVFFPYGPDWMNVAWLDKDHWSPGLQRIDRLGSGPGMILIIDLFDSKSGKVIEHEFKPFLAEQICNIFTPNEKRKIGELWAIDPKGDLSCGTFQFSLDACSNWNFIPMAQYAR